MKSMAALLAQARAERKEQQGANVHLATATREIRRLGLALRGTTLAEVNDVWRQGGVPDGGAAYNLDRNGESEAQWEMRIQHTVCFAQALGSTAIVLLRNVPLTRGEAYNCGHGLTLPKCHALGEAPVMLTWISLAGVDPGRVADLVVAVLYNLNAQFPELAQM